MVALYQCSAPSLSLFSEAVTVLPARPVATTCERQWQRLETHLDLLTRADAFAKARVGPAEKEYDRLP
jgi:hypothetical protein